MMPYKRPGEISRVSEVLPPALGGSGAAPEAYERLPEAGHGEYMLAYYHEHKDLNRRNQQYRQRRIKAGAPVLRRLTAEEVDYLRHAKRAGIPWMSAAHHLAMPYHTLLWNPGSARWSRLLADQFLQVYPIVAVAALVFAKPRCSIAKLLGLSLQLRRMLDNGFARVGNIAHAVDYATDALLAAAAQQPRAGALAGELRARVLRRHGRTGPAAGLLHFDQ